LTVIIATHVTFGAYGFWLPNDPRGSWSDFVRSAELVQFGKATKVDTPRSLAKDTHDVQLRRAAKKSLAHPPVRFTGAQALSIAQGFARAVAEGKYTVYACAILPVHCHLVIADHVRPIRMIVAHLKGRATMRLKEAGHYNWELESPWVRNCWRVFLNSPSHVVRAIRYVEENPVKEGKRKQTWSFVTEYKNLRTGARGKPHR
jgi:REP element-mobilizing transposase RayT